MSFIIAHHILYNVFIFDSYTESPANYILTLPVAMDRVENAAEVTAYQEKVKQVEAQVVSSYTAAPS